MSFWSTFQTDWYFNFQSKFIVITIINLVILVQSRVKYSVWFLLRKQFRNNLAKKRKWPIMTPTPRISIKIRQINNISYSDRKQDQKCSDGHSTVPIFGSRETTPNGIVSGIVFGKSTQSKIRPSSWHQEDLGFFSNIQILK